MLTWMKVHSEGVAVVLAAACIALVVWLGVSGCSTKSQSSGQAQPSSQPGQQVVELGNGRRIIASPDAKVIVDIPQDVNERQQESSATATGIRTSAGKVVSDYKADLPSTKITRKGIFSDSGEVDFSLEALASTPFAGFYVFGGILVVGGIIVFVWLKQLPLGFALIVSGVALIGAAVLFEQYPWIVWVGLGALALLGAYLLYRSYKAKQTKTALTGIAAAIEKAPAEAQSAVKEQIQAENESLGGVIKKVVTPIKAKVGL